MKKGVFIVIDGSDGSGKGTQHKLLQERLQQEGIEFEVVDFPQYEQPSSYFVRQYLNGHYGNADEVGPHKASLFYALDRFDVSPKIEAALRQGKVVIANRFSGSNMGHQGTKIDDAKERHAYFAWNDKLEHETLGIPRPDLNIVLLVPAAVGQQNVDKKAARIYTNLKRDIHENHLGHLERAVEVYKELCDIFPERFVKIDCMKDETHMKSVEEIHENIWQKVTSLLQQTV